MNIYGEIMRPCFMSEDDYEKGWKRSVFNVDKNYKEEYQRHLIAMSHIAQIAKSYVLRNWKSVIDWSDLDIKITMNSETTHYYKYREAHKINMKGKSAKIFEEFDRELKENQNPAVSVSDVVLDPTDGDFSLTINGKVHMWISDDEVIALADYVENQLKPENTEE